MGKKLSVLDWLFVGTLLVIFGGIVVHAPLSVWLSTLFPDATFVIKSWKEMLLGFALVCCVVILTIKRKWSIIHDRLIQYVLLFATLNLLTIPLFHNGFEATIAGLFISLRFFLFFVLVYSALKLYPHLYRLFLRVFIAGALVVIGFAILQVTVLPNDFLKYIGYGESTIMPYLTVDQNESYVRINSTLRGPNPLGAYAVIVLAFVLTAWLMSTRKLTRREEIIAGILAAGSVVALWVSYSRSAALAAVAAIGIVLLVVYGRRISKRTWIAIVLGGLVLTGSLVAFRETQFVSQVILHEDPSEGNAINSNDGHSESIIDGTRRLLEQPLGAGVGSTGSASLFTDKPLLIENEYLYVAHETGWLGLALFAVIYYGVLQQLWRRRTQWLALGVCASGVGLAIAGLFLPVWVDDTVSIIWWGLAAIALALPIVQAKKKPSNRSTAKGKKS
jgi:hypothetical protein